MEVACLISGGKDSIYATYLAMQEGHRVKYLITMFPENKESWMFHYPCLELTKLQSKSMGINQIIGKTKGEKEKELQDLKSILEKVKNKIEGVVSGAISSQYQKSRIDKICKELKLKSIAPIWHKDPEQLLREEVKSGFETIITGVFADGFDERWLGRRIDEKCIEDLINLNRKYGVNINGEGGEYESFVFNCPLFKKMVRILDSKTVWDRKTNSGYMLIEKARLA